LGDNPDQRISEDVKIFTEHSMRLAVALALGISLCVLYSCILWTNGPAVEMGGLKIYGYLFWIAVLFGLITNGFTHIAGRRLIGLTGELQKREANYRSTLTRQREADRGWQRASA
jgi:putative ATP-binding cassette transporter